MDSKEKIVIKKGAITVSAPKQKKKKKQTNMQRANAPKSTPAPKTPAVKKLGSATGYNRPRLGDCARRYLLAISDPFHPEARGACVPDFPSIPSQKVTYFARGSGSSGTTTADAAFVAVIPASLLLSDATDAILFTIGGASGQTIPNAVAGGVTAGATTNSPYTLATYVQGQLTTRIVSVGIRVRCTGTELNKGGTIVGITERTHNAVNGKTITQIRNYDYCQAFEYDHDWFELTLGTGVISSELAYGTTGSPTVRCMAIAILPAAANQPFDWEVVVHAEQIGTKITTPDRSPADPLGFAAAQEALSGVPQGNTLYKSASSFSRNLYNSLLSAAERSLEEQSHAVSSFMTQAAGTALGVLGGAVGASFYSRRGPPRLGPNNV